MTYDLSFLKKLFLCNFRICNPFIFNLLKLGMKKHLFALGILPLCVATSFAQSPKTLLHKKQQQKLNQLLAWQQSALPTSSAAKPTAIRERVIAIANYMGTEGLLSLTDSIKYQYSQGRGSAYGFDFESGHYPGSSFELRRNLEFEAMEPFAGAGYVHYDSAFYYNPYSTPPELSATAAQTFNNINKIASFVWKEDDDEYAETYTYDGFGRLTSITNDVDEGESIWYFYDNDQQTMPSRDSSNNSKGVYTLDDNYRPVHAEMYEKNGGNNWTLSETYRLSYNSRNGLMDTFRVASYGDSIVITFTYEENNTVPASISEYSWDLDILNWKNTRHFGASGLPDSTTLYLSAEEEGTERTFTTYFTYNDKNNPVKKAYQMEGDDGNMIEMEERYYYEEYDDKGSSVAGATKVNVQINCYPNPVESALNLHIEGSRAFAPASVNIIDVAGRTVKHINIAGARNRIDVSGLHSGIYYITVRDKHNQQSASKMIVKQ